MNHQAFKKVRFGLGLTVIAVAIGAFAAVGSAAAATQHWATASPAAELSPGSYQSFSGKKETNVKLKWQGINLEVSCTALSTSGKVENPASGTRGSLFNTSFELGGCTTSLESCQIVNGTIPFRPLKGYALDEGAEERVRFEPETGTEIATLNFGSKCALGSTVIVTGSFEATSLSSQPGKYEIARSNMAIGSQKLTMATEVSLSTLSGQPLTLSSEGSPGVPHWYTPAGKWSLIPTGESINWATTEYVPLHLSVKVGLAPVIISGCSGIVDGKVENPTGGGAGTVPTSIFLFNGCAINYSACYVERATAPLLSGAATEVGGLPAVEWSSSKEVFGFILGSTPGSECPLLPNNPITVTGKLIATSLGNGHFKLASSELKVGSQKATVGNEEFAMETNFGKSLRLQP